MQIIPIQTQQATTSRFTREWGETGVGRRFRLEGDARPGDVLALAGGALVYDRNGNGIVDGYDASVADEDALAGRIDTFDTPADALTRLGALLDVRG
jgi:hypothetical protein